MNELQVSERIARHQREEFIRERGWMWKWRRVEVEEPAPKPEPRKLYSDELYMLMRPQIRREA